MQGRPTTDTALGAREVADALLRSEPLWAPPVYLLTFFLPSVDPGLNPLGGLGLAIVVTLWSLRKWRRGYFTRPSMFDLPFGLFLASALFGLLPSSYPLYSLARLWVLVGCYALYHVVVNHSSDHSLKGYVLITFFGGIVVMLALMTQVSGVSEYPEEGGLIGPLKPALERLANLPKIRPANVPLWKITRSGIAGSAMAIFPFLWPLAHLSSTRGTRSTLMVLAGVLGIMFLMIVVASGGIGALVALFAGALVVALLARRFALAAGIAFAVILPAVYALTLPVGTGVALYILTQINIRLDLWQSAAYTIRDFPLTGIGPGMENWFSRLPLYAMPNLDIYYDEPGEHVLLHAHNFYLQTWIDQGVLGFVALVAIGVVGLYAGGRSLRATTGFRRAVGMAGLWSFISLMIHNLAYSGPSSQGILILWIALGLMTASGKLHDDLTENPVGEGQLTRGVRAIAAEVQRKGPEGPKLLSVRDWLWLCFVLLWAAVAWVPGNPGLGMSAAALSGLGLALASIEGYKQNAVYGNGRQRSSSFL